MLKEKIKIEADFDTIVLLRDSVFNWIAIADPKYNDFTLKLIETTLIGLIKTFNAKTLFYKKHLKFSIKTTEALALQEAYLKGFIKDDVFIRMLISDIHQKLV